ncbi:MAG TPA: IS3 family transposase [Elusimicrobia bacterium]|nr:IS3 family transposase [Elusimicrobiota bacterium]
MIAKANKLSKAALAKEGNISRASLYYHPKKPRKDWHLKNEIEKVLQLHPSYGIKPYRRRGRIFRRTKDLGAVFPNLLQIIPLPSEPKIIWVSDFTPISFHGRLVYLATIMDIFDRRIMGWNLLANHSVQLTLNALIDAVEKYGRPKILHSDQGSEYKSGIYTKFAAGLGINLSMSHKGSPWENGFQESFYSQFKVDIGDPNRFRTLGELAAEIYYQIHYYNTQRIHTKLKMPPAIFAERHQLITNLNTHY